MDNYKFMVRVNCVTYNHAPYITDTFDGFCAQKTQFPYVCTIIDDCSTDGEQGVIEDYLTRYFENNDVVVQKEETDDYFFIFSRHKVNYNCYFAVFFLKYNHHSIRKSKLPYFDKQQIEAKYIALCEGDDYWVAPDKLQMQVDYLEHNPSYVLCFTNYLTLSEDGAIQKNKISDLPNDDDYSLDLITKGNKLATLTVLYRTEGRNSIPKMFSQNKWKMGDLPLWIELSQIGLFKYLPEVTAVYRKLANSASHSTDINKRLDFIKGTYEIKKYYARYFEKISVDYLDKKMYEVLLNEAFLSKNVEMAKSLYKEAKSKKYHSYDLWKTFTLTVHTKNPIVVFYLWLRKIFR